MFRFPPPGARIAVAAAQTAATVRPAVATRRVRVPRSRLAAAPAPAAVDAVDRLDAFLSA